jgi:hypothetical protein
LAVGSALVLHATTARAQDDKPELAFSADEVEGDGRLRELVLRGNVIVTYERFRLTSPALALRRTPRGIEVRGPGEVVFCPCPNPPVSVGFESGVVAPPAELFLTHPSLRVAGTEIFALPWFWLRAPSRPGILPPNLAWRGGDGLLIGDGLHIPWKDGADYDELDLTGSAYIKGGVELVARLRTPRSTQRVRWDHLGSDLVAVDAHGSYPQPNEGAVAWDIDAVRGPRARSASMTLDEGARAYDRAAGETMFRPSDGAIVGAGVRAVGARGGTGPSESSAWGPRAALGFGGAIDAFGAWDALTTATVLADPRLGTTNLARSEGGVDLAARPSIFVLRFVLREAITAADTGELAALDAVGSGRIEVSAPLARAYASDEAPLVHVIEPRLQGSLLAARTSGAYWSATGRPVALTSGEVAVASAGVRTAWGRLLGHSGGALEIDAGGVAPLGDAVLIDPSSLAPVELASAGHPATVARLRTSWSSRYVGWGTEAASLLRSPRGRLLVGKARLGERDGWHLVGKATGRVGIEPLVARALASATAEEPSGGWLAAEGWSAGAEIGARLTRSVGATLSAQEDLTEKTLLDVHGSISYAHPCRCIAIDAFGGKRLGRDGIDVWVSIDLAPR